MDAYRNRWTPIELPKAPGEEMDLQMNFSFDVSFVKGPQVGPDIPRVEGFPVCYLLGEIGEMLRTEIFPPFLRFFPADTDPRDLPK